MMMKTEKLILNEADAPEEVNTNTTENNNNASSNTTNYNDEFETDSNGLGDIETDLKNKNWDRALRTIKQTLYGQEEDDALNDLAERYLKSELNATDDQIAPIKEIVASEFDEVGLDENKNIMIPYLKNFKKNYNNLPKVNQYKIVHNLWSKDIIDASDVKKTDHIIYRNLTLNGYDNAEFAVKTYNWFGNQEAVKRNLSASKAKTYLGASMSEDMDVQINEAEITNVDFGYNERKKQKDAEKKAKGTSVNWSHNLANKLRDKIVFEGNKIRTKNEILQELEKVKYTYEKDVDDGHKGFNPKSTAGERKQAKELMKQVENRKKKFSELTKDEQKILMSTLYYNIKTGTPDLQSTD